MCILYYFSMTDLNHCKSLNIVSEMNNGALNKLLRV